MPRFSDRAAVTIRSTMLGTTLMGLFIAPSAIAQRPIAQPPVTPVAPTTLNQSVQALTSRIDSAANQKDLNAVLGFYSLEFTNSDGLNRQTLSQSLKQLWQQYPKLTYRTEVLSANNKGNGVEAETMTYVTGKQGNNGREWNIDIKLKSRQRWENQKLVQQEILSEQTRLSLGEKPPTVRVNLPETVKSGQRYEYEAVMEEPIGDDLVMGEVFERTITANALTQPNLLQLEIPVLEFFRRAPVPASKGTTKIKLQRINSGGFFKYGFAPKNPENRWLSAVLVRHDAGVTIVTNRLRVVQ